MGDITRRNFFNRAGAYGLGGLVGVSALHGLAPRAAAAAAAVQPRLDWLSRTDEAAIEPEFPIIDPHHHLWDRPGNRYMLEDLVEVAERSGSAPIYSLLKRADDLAQGV